MPADAKRVKELFGAALDLPDAAARRDLLDRECGDDVELRHRLDALLVAHDDPASAMERPFVSAAVAGGLSPTLADVDPVETAGAVVAGRYKLLQQIGDGGMGIVWLAEQTEPVQRKVALKIIRPASTAARSWPASRPSVKPSP